MEDLSYYPNDARWSARVEEQQSMHAKSWIDNLLIKNIMPRGLIAEYKWMQNISARQPTNLSKIYQNAPLIPRNYIHKLFHDRIHGGAEFVEFYKPHPEHHVINWLLQKEITYDKENNIYSFATSATDFLPLLIRYAINCKINTLIQSWRAPDNTLKYYALQRYAELKGGVPTTIMTLDLLRDPYLITDIGQIVCDKNDSNEKNMEVIYTRYGAPDDKVEKESYNEYRKLYVLSK